MKVLKKRNVLKVKLYLVHTLGNITSLQASTYSVFLEFKSCNLKLKIPKGMLKGTKIMTLPHMMNTETSVVSHILITQVFTPKLGLFF